MLFDTTQLALERSISGAAQRHEALSANIANASTPGYQRVDVDFHGALAAAMGSSDARNAIEHTGFTTQADRTVGADARRRRLDRHRRRVGQAGRQRARPAGCGLRRQDPQRDPAFGHGCRLMSMFGGMEISASALTAQRLRMNVTAENLANAQTTRGADGQPYRRKEVVLQSVSQGGFGAQLSAAMGGWRRSRRRRRGRGR